jgi:hypothetical protein
MTGFDAPPPLVSPVVPAAPPAPVVQRQRQRPSVTIGATLVALGGALMIAGSILNWFDLDKETFNGFTSGLEDVTNVKGGLFDVLGAVVLGFGITQLIAKRVLAIGIIGAVLSSVGLLVGLKALSDVNDLVDFGRLFGSDVSTGPGLYVAIAGGAIATIGSIATVAKQPV